jgi:hypothetical protein
MKTYTEYCLHNYNGRDSLADSGVDGMITLKQTMAKEVMKM